jgi:hypothetical protein
VLIYNYRKQGAGIRRSRILFGTERTVRVVGADFDGLSRAAWGGGYSYRGQESRTKLLEAISEHPAFMVLC